ncbi:MAG: molybdopterin molybdotransferase MoeA [Actinobacteria bacterium]|nr:molybdopterin molybdotransferase MoeA [Actinomycetota bacterium]
MPASLISLAEARRIVLAAAPAPAAPEDVELSAGLGRILAEDVVAHHDLPPFDNSAMDGYAVRAGPAAELDVVGESRAGVPASAPMGPGQAIRISTGAAVPDGADAVVPIELAAVADRRVAVPETAPGANVRRAGEDVRAGVTVLGAGSELGPAGLGVLASLGRGAAKCRRRPGVALLATGDELVGPGRELRPGEIHDSNAIALAAQAVAAGAELVFSERVRDDRAATVDALRRAFRESDFVCVAGGVSVGPHDHVKGALADLGVDELFWGVAIKPGKPTCFGTADGGVPVLGLPGNPVSAMVVFHLIGRPLLRVMLGADPHPAATTAVLDSAVARSPSREQAVRCALRAAPDGWHAEPTGSQGSHVLTSMLGAQALALIAPGEGEAAAGDRIAIELLPGGTLSA